MAEQLQVPQANPANYAQAWKICFTLLVALGLDRKLHEAINEDNIPLGDIPPLPDYRPADPRATTLRDEIAYLALTLQIVNGIQTIIDANVDAQATPRRIKMMKRLGTRYVEVAKKLLLPRVVITVLKQKESILADLSTFLNHCLYDSENDILHEAGRYAAERNVGANVFLAVCPNLPFIVPTLELRLLFSKPLLGLASAMHALFGKIFVFGFFFVLLVKFAQLFDGIARFQVQLVQRILINRWLSSEQQRVRLVERYLKDAKHRVEKPQTDVIIRGLLSLVS